LNSWLEFLRTSRSSRVVGGALLFVLGYAPLIDFPFFFSQNKSVSSFGGLQYSNLLNGVLGFEKNKLSIGDGRHKSCQLLSELNIRNIANSLRSENCFKKIAIEKGPYSGGIFVSGKIKSNFYVDARKAGIPAGVVDSVVSKLSSKINFKQALKSGDQFEIAFNGSRELLYAKISTKRSKVSVYKYGKEGYFLENGQKLTNLQGSNIFGLPLRGGMVVSSKYGYRRHPVTGKYSRHTGIDLKANYGTPVYAIFDGVVTRASNYSGYGKCIDIAHKANYSSRYAHLSKFVVSNGARVKKGQLIGYSGSTGISTGPHLHLELAKNSRTVNPLSVKMIPESSSSVSNKRRFNALVRYANNLESNN